MPPAANGSSSLCIFRRNRELFGLPILHVQEVLSVRDISAVPGSPSYLLGITNLRGDALPIVIIDRFMGIDEDRSAPVKVIVLRIDDALIGVVVDGVVAVATAPEGGLTETEVSRGKNRSGVFQFGNGLVSVLDTRALLKEILDDMAASPCFSTVKGD